MKRLYTLPLIVLLAMAMPAYSQDVTVPGFSAAQAAAAEPISIIGPDTAVAGTSVTLRLAGTPSIDLSKPLIDQLAWLMGEDRMFAYVMAPKKPMAPLDVEATIVFASNGATMRPQVTFGVADPGEYRVIVDWNYGQNQLVEHTVTVGGDPVPPIPPDPPIPPVPVPSKLSVLLSYEAENQPTAEPSQADLLSSPTIRAYLNSHCVVVDGQPDWRFLDLSDDDGSSMSAKWQTVIARAKGKTTPWLVIDNGNATYEGPCPTNAVDLLAKLKEYGGE